MNLLTTLKDRFLKLIQTRAANWWVEITTTTPRCVYYFGPFLTQSEAETAQFGYLEDLHNENAQGISIQIKQCQPTVLTIFDEDGEA